MPTMSTRPPPPLRLAVGLRVCAALLVLAASCASETAPGGAGPDFTGERVGAAEPGTVSPDTEAATAQTTVPVPEAESAAAQPEAETAVAPVPDPDSSPDPDVPPIEDDATTEPDVQPPDDTTTGTDDTTEPSDDTTTEPSDNATTQTEEQPSDDTTTEPSDDTTQTEEQPPDDTTTEPSDDTTIETDEQSPDDTTEPPDDTTADTDQQPPDDTTADTDQQPPDDAATEAEGEHAEAGAQLSRGGELLFEPGDGSPARRLVAAYGHPSSGALGVLGEQGPEEAVERLRSIAEGYEADGSAILPTFEIIATVASASAGADGDYSRMTDHEAIRPWIEVAAANGVYVVLDLQPGRSDFLSQAKHYEEFLRLPHVGLALDPEWRLKPDQVHLRQVGTVDAAEINRVAEWLAGIVREDALPQKLLIVHQFRFSMITNREQIETPPELAVMIHMDGQGSLGAKYNTWNALTGEPDADQFYWGWKNFYDEDSPMATPEQVLELSPNIFFVSFQ